jgi:hypothetical protein
MALQSGIDRTQRLALGNMAGFGLLAQWLFTGKLQRRALATDDAEHTAPISGLDTLA